MPGHGLLPCHANILSFAYCFFVCFLGNACRDKVRRYLRVNFANLSDAEEAYSINYFHDDELFGIRHEVTSTPTSSNQVPYAVHASPMLAFSPLKHAEERNLPGSVLDVVSSGFVELTKRQRQQLMVYLFHKWLKLDVHQELNANYVSLDFLPLLSNALKVLLVNGKNNVLYDAARCFGEMRPEEDCPRMPLSRMPFGLISHNLRFFASDNASYLEAPPDYKSWYQSMYTLFGNKWAAMHNGPMWSYTGNADEEVESAPSADQSSDILTQALQQTFECDFELLTLESNVAAEPTQNYEVSDISPVEPNIASTTETTIATAVPTRNVEVSETSPVDSNITSSDEAISITAMPAGNLKVSEISAAESIIADSAAVSCAPTATEEPTPPTSFSRSSLWSSLSESQRREDEGATLNERELGEIHGIFPSNHGACNTERNPLKVLLLMRFYIHTVYMYTLY